MIDSGLAERIIEFDKKNMQPVFEKAGLEFPEEKRRRGLDSDPTFIIAFDGESIAGYIEYLRSWNDPAYIYIGSIQIESSHRNTRLILMLFDKFRDLVSREDFLGFETNVQKANEVGSNVSEAGFQPGRESEKCSFVGGESGQGVADGVADYSVTGQMASAAIIA